MRRTENQVRDEIALREASLGDAKRELAAGELSPVQAATIEARETLALAAARRELDEMAQSGGRSPSRQRRRILLVVGVGCFLVAIIVVLVASLSLRQAGTSDTGGVTVGPAQKVNQLLTEAEGDVASGNAVAALSAYEQVLALSPRNVQALTQTGWLEFSAGSSDENSSLVQLGIKDLREAIAYGPSDPAPRLYYAIVADSTPDNAALAKRELEIFLTLKPSADELAIARPFLKQFGLPGS